MRRTSRHVEVRDAVIDRTAQITAEQNHGGVCGVLKWARRTPGVTGDEIGVLCEQLGLSLLDAMAYGRQKARKR